MGTTAGATRRVTLREAAGVLGVSKEAVRKRAARGTLPHERDADGRVYVYLDGGDAGGGDAGTDAGTDARDALIAELKEEVAAWREESRRKDHIIAALVERVPELAPSEARDGPLRGSEGSGWAEDGTDGGGAQNSSERRSWWRRWFGFE